MIASLFQAKRARIGARTDHQVVECQAILIHYASEAVATENAVSRVESLSMRQQPLKREAGSDSVMELFAKQVRRDAEEPAETTALGAVSTPGQLRRDFDMACELLDRASQAFEVLIERCQGLEKDLSDVSALAETRAAELADSVEQWKRLATGLKDQLDVSDQKAGDLATRCEAAEERAVLAEKRAKALEAASLQAANYATAAETLSTKLHDRVVKSFGIGSQIHAVLEAVASRPKD